MPNFSPSSEENKEHTKKWLSDIISGILTRAGSTPIEHIRLVLLTNKKELSYFVNNTVIKYHVISWLKAQGISEASLKTALNSTLYKGYTDPNYLRIWLSRMI